MRLPLELPSGDEIYVTLEYEKLEKHCFICYSLCHEKESCPLKRDKTTKLDVSQGISQQNTLRKLEDHRRRHDIRSISLSSRDRGLEYREHQTSSQISIHSVCKSLKEVDYPLRKAHDRAFPERRRGEATMLREGRGKEKEKRITHLISNILLTESVHQTREYLETALHIKELWRKQGPSQGVRSLITQEHLPLDLLERE